MTQNFKRRITLLPNSKDSIQNSLKKFKDIDLEEKADNDTFNKTLISKNTPKKEKKINPYLLETPKIEKSKERRISIYSPLSFGENSFMEDNPISNEKISIHKNFEKNSSEKKVTNFNYHITENQEIDIQNINTCFSMNKIKKLNKNNRKFENVIVFNNDKYQKYIFPLFNDNDIYRESNIINKNNENIFLKAHDDENSDKE